MKDGDSTVINWVVIYHSEQGNMSYDCHLPYTGVYNYMERTSLSFIRFWMNTQIHAKYDTKAKNYNETR